MIAPHELERLAASGRTVLKDEDAATVEVLGPAHGQQAVVRKTYHNRGLRFLQSMLRRSRAQREHDNLLAIAAAGVSCVQALGWSQRRRWFGAVESTLVTRFVPAAVPLKSVLAAPAPPAPRRALATAMGALVGAMHHAGLLWCTPMPRNVLVVGELAAARLVVCDPPSCVRLGRPIHGSRLARIDLFLGAFSPSRRRDWSGPERLRWLLGYCRGDRDAARTLWRAVARRRPLVNEIHRALAMAWHTYILGPLRPRRAR